MNKPRIFYLSTSLNIGGTEKFVITLVKNLSYKYDFTVGIVKDKGEFGEILSQQGIPVMRFRNPLTLAYYLKRNKIEIIHTFLYRANILGRIAGKIAGIKTIISTQRAIDLWKNTFLSFIDELTYSFCSLILVNSMAAKRSVVKNGKYPPEKVQIVCNGIDFNQLQVTREKNEIRRTLLIDPSQRVIVSVARLNKEKGMDYLPSIVEKTAEGIFLVVGDGIERKNMEDSIRKKGLESRFIFTGWRLDIPLLLKASDIFLLPSREESFPQAVLEAMALKLPIVASDIGGVNEVVVDKVTGLLVKSGDISGFAKSLQYLINNPELAEQMGQNGYNSCQKYSEKSMVDNMDAVYSKFL